MAEKKTSKASGGDLKKVMGYVRPYSVRLTLSMIMAAAVVVLTLYLPILVGDAIDLIIAPGRVDLAGIRTIAEKAAVIAGVTALVQWIMNTVNNHITFHVVRDMREAAFRRIQILPLSYLDVNPSGGIVNRVIADADQFADGLLMGFTQLFSGVVMILCTLVFMVKLNWKMALVVVFLTPLSMFVAKFISKRTYSMFRLQSETRGEQTAYIDEMIGNMKVVKAFGRERAALEKFDEINERLRSCSLRATFFSSLTNPSTRFVNNVVYAGVALTGAIACLGSGFTVGALTCFLAYVNQYTKPFNEISGVITELQNSLACAGRLFELIEAKPQTPDDPDAGVLENASGDIRLDNVDFSYVPDKKLIEELSLDVKSGMRVAIVGPTGCGKTTIINLLMRFYDVDGGGISVDGGDIRSITRNSLRKNYGMVLQETWLRSGTIRDNIIMGRPDATLEEVIAAAKASHAHSFIKRLPQGYNTYIGEDGGSLSQGQKQLLCITRVMLCLPPMLILDEATSSIDTRTEIRIQQAFAKMMEGRTCFIVAHRLSTIAGADVILVMKNGRVIEKGRHEELLKKGGFYSELYNSQFAEV